MTLNKYDIDCSNQTTKAVYEKRYRKNGEEYLKKVDEIDIEEDLKEKSLEVNRIKEIFNNQERLKENQLFEEFTEENKIKELEMMQNYSELDTYSFLNKTMEIQGLYNRMPEEVRKKYKDISKFTKEYLPKFTKDCKENLKIVNEKNNQLQKQETINKTNEDLQKQIDELQKQLKGETNV